MRTPIAVLSVVAAAAAAFCGTAVAHADPVAPQEDAECMQSLDGAVTRSPDNETLLQCRAQFGSEYRWEAFTAEYPSSDRWVSYGPALTLYGEGRRNPEIASGDWVAYPLTAGDRCVAAQTPVVAAGVLGIPQMSAGLPSQPLLFRVVPRVFRSNSAATASGRRQIE